MTMKLSTLITTGILLSSATGLALADETQRYNRQELVQQQNEVRINNQGDDYQIRNRLNESSGKGEMIRQRNMNSSFGGGQSGKGMGGTKGKR